ncbi:MAG: DUF1328 domain-containing protein [Myxococcales bacterium]|nr:DUF1328 domain-containing protein [Myxococcales bacterium]
MLYWIIAFFILALVAGAFGFSGLAAGFSWVAQLLAVLFVGLFLASIIFNGVNRAASGHTP